MLAASAATTALQLAASRQYPISAELAAARDIYYQLVTLADAPPPLAPPLPDNPREVPAAVADYARRFSDTAHTKTAVDDFMRLAVARIVTGYRTELPSWLELLAKDFAEQAGILADTLPNAVDTFTPGLGQHQIEASTRAATAAAQLDGFASIRSQFGRCMAEGGAHLTSVFLVAEPPEPPSDPAELIERWPAIQQLEADYQKLPIGGLTRWRHLTNAAGWTIALAGPGDVDTRTEAFRQWHQRTAAAVQGGRTGLAAQMAHADRTFWRPNQTTG
ncbi:MAG: hypothetical protein ACR2MP_01980 [Streptosporangiaceae bacterium]